MYRETSNAFDARIAEPGRTFSARLVCGDEVIEKGISSIQFKAQANSDTNTIEIGGTVSTYIEVSVLHPEYMVTGKEYDLLLGLTLPDGSVEYCPMGKFTPQKPEEEDELVTFTAYDRMVSKLELPYFTQIGKYPADGKQILQEISRLSGVPFCDLTVLPDGVMVGWRTVYQENSSTTTAAPFTGYTYREALMYLAQMYGRFVTVNRDGELEFRWYESADYQIPANRSYDDIACAEQIYELQRLRCAVGQNELTAGSGTTGITIENDLMTQEILDQVYGWIGGFTYLPTTVSFLGDPRVELGDIVTVYRRDGTAIPVPVMSLDLEYDGGLRTSIGSYGSTEESEDKAQGPTAKAIDRVYSELFLVKEVLADKASINYLEANYATIKALDAVEAKIDRIVATDITVDYLEANYAKLEYVESSFATIDLANVQDAAVKTAMIDVGAVQTAQIADGSITDAKIVELTANKITAGTLSVERLELVGSDSSLVYALNNSGELVSQSVNTLDGAVLTDRTVTADKLVAKSVTAAEIAADTITANEIAANAITTAELAAGSVTTAVLASGSVTAEKISVTDLNALKATIGGFTIGQSYLANGTTTIGGSANSVYVGLDGISCGQNFIAKKDGTVTVRGAVYCKDIIYLYSSYSNKYFPVLKYADTGGDTNDLFCYTPDGYKIFGYEPAKSGTLDFGLDMVAKGISCGAVTSSSLKASGTVQGSTVSWTVATGRSIELSYSTPFIDFHAGNSSADYTSRLIASVSGRLDCVGDFYVSGNIHNNGRLLCSGSWTINASNLFVANESNSGFVTIYAAGVVNPSSRLVKENICAMPKEEAEKLLQLEIVDFDYRKEFGGTTGMHGVIAEDALDIIPSCVVVPKGYSEKEFDLENGIQNKVLSVDYSKLVPHLIKMVQLQQARLEEQQAELNLIKKSMT